MLTSTSLRWLVVAVSAAMLLMVAAACGSETVEVPGETVIVEKEVVKTVEVPGETVVVEKVVTETVEVPGETVTKEVVKTVEVPGETVVVEKEVVKTVEVPGETVTVEVVKEVQVPGETVIVEKEVVKTVEVPGQTVVVEKEVVKEVQVDEQWTRNARGELVERPRYGGTLVVDGPSWQDAPDEDPWMGKDVNYAGLVMEKLAMPDYGLPREVYSFQEPFLPVSRVKGQLAASWEQPNLETIIFNIRPGVYWHDKAPMNGRELDAYDVEFTWHRMFGIADKYGFTEPYLWNEMQGVPVDSVTATDKWTVVFKASSFSFKTLRYLLYHFQLGWVQPPEVIKEHGDLSDWKNIVGTGPYELTDAVEGSSATLSKNHNYWGYDENFPENRLPYIDEIRLLIMPDFSTRLAALRTGKIALLREFSFPIDVAQNLQQTNPELKLDQVGTYTQHIGLKVFEPPFDDVNVRIAMQKALDLETINETYYLGYADPTPYGTAGPGLEGFYIPFNDWPEEQQYGFRYDPAEARQLLADAGYPDGFKTVYDVSPDWGMDADLAQILKVYWAEIGVDVDLNVLESGLMAERAKNRLYEGMSYDEGFRMETDYAHASLRVNYGSGMPWNIPGVNDATFDALLDKVETATNVEDFQQWTIEADMYHVSQHWAIMLPNKKKPIFYQPWLKGFAGESKYPGDNVILARAWIDQELKQKMGH